jgi:hypothetical protein
MRFFARAFLLSALLIYIFVIGFQLIPKDGSLGIVETVFRSGRQGVTVIKQFFFQDSKLITFETPQGVDVPIPITVDLVPDENRFTGTPQETKPKPPSTGGVTKPQNNPTIIQRIISFIPFVPNNTPQTTTPTPQVLPLSLSCAGTNYGNDIAWSATASGGSSSNYTYSWAGQPFTNSPIFRVSYTTSGTKTITVTARDSAGNQTERTCQSTLTITSSNTPTNSNTISPSNLTLSCFATVNGSQLTWRATPQGGNAPYRFEWSGNASGSTQDVVNNYTTAGVKTASLTVTDNAGLQAQTQCQGTPVITATPPPPPPPPPPPQVTTCNLDYCSQVAVRTDARYINTTSCIPVWDTDEIAQYADELWYGVNGSELPNTRIAYPWTQCFGTQSLSAYRAYNDEVDAKATALNRTVHKVNSFRFDIITPHIMAQPGFNSDWLVRSATPHQTLLDFYTNDTSPVCVNGGGCRFSYSYGGAYYEGRDTGNRMRDMIDESGGTGTYEDIVYYITRQGSNETVGWASAAVADQRIPAYRTWRVNQARQIIQDGHFDFVLLNHKFHFFRPDNWSLPRPEPWLGGSGAPNVAAHASSDNTPFSNQPLNYGYAEYVQGWNALARDLDAANVPFAVQTNGGQWVIPDTTDDPLTPGVNEGALIREAIELADFVEVDYQSWLGPTRTAQLDQVVRDLEAGGAIVLKINSGCGLPSSGTPTSCTTAQSTNMANQLAQTPRTPTSIIFTIARVTLLLVIVSLLYARRKNTA